MSGGTNLHTWAVAFVLLLGMAYTASAKQTVYVDGDASAGGNGRTWATAHKYLQDALAHATSDTNVSEIRIAQGIYRPDEISADPNGTGDPEATFQLINGVALKGGYAGLGEPDPNARDIKMHQTILSGDLNGDDGPNFANNDENSHHVVTGSGTDSTATLDGFIVTSGNADGGDPHNDGGGMYRCRGPITNCTISMNYAGDDGGGLYKCNGPITNCTIMANTAEHEGGGLSLCDGQITNCLIIANTAQWGAGLDCCYGLIINCTISGNRAYTGVSGLAYCDGPVVNCIIWDNITPTGTQVEGSSPTYSCVQNWAGGMGNIDTDPCFVDMGYWDPNGTPADANDDFWVGGDYHLLSDSPCIDAGRYFYCMHLPYSEHDGETRVVAGQIDMGCYEANGLADADGDWLGAPDEQLHGTDPDLADTDGDGLVDGVEIMLGTDPLLADPLWMWEVPGDANSIQQALFFSRSGESVVVSEGTYHENIYLGGRNVILTSTDPNDVDVVASTIVNGDTDANFQTPNGRAISFQGIEDANCEIRGLTITRGYGYWGGGIHGADSNAKITSCIITGNSVGYNGGGLYKCNGRITNCTISNNTAENGCGGGMYECDALIANSTISGNIAYSHGGGMHGCEGSITNCTISENSAKYGGGLAWCYSLIANCTFIGNMATDLGGALYKCDKSITNCTIIGNTAKHEGGGLLSCHGPITNCIIWSNTALPGPQLLDCSNPTYSCIENWTDGGEENINSEPLLVDPGYWDPNGTPTDTNDDFWVDGDYHLLPDSPCIDKGDSNAVPTDIVDLDGDGEANEPIPWDLDSRPRLTDGDCNDIDIVDMGAYEFAWAFIGDFDGQCDVDFKDFGVLALAWLTEDGEGEYNPVCDISLPADSFIDENDLKIFIDNWLAFNRRLLRN